MLSKNLIYITTSVLLLSACIGTDEVEDTLTTIEIEVPDDVTIVNGSFAKLVGQVAQLDAHGTSDLGGSFLLDGATWQSDNPSVASIDADGIVTALSPGTTQIIASGFGIASDPIMVNVTDDENAIALIAISAPDDQTVVEPETTVQLTATALTAGGSEVPGATFDWSSEDEAIATVDEQGLVSTLSDGTVAIVATTGSVSSRLELQVGNQESLSRTAALVGLNGYDVTGSAILSATGSGALQLQLSEDFSVQNGPGLYLYLSNNRTNINGGVEISELRSNSGADIYNLPGTVELQDFSHVLVWCRPFGVGFGTGALE
ncbi:MAG: DM13 domain-containing protein [Bacteroidota bacterium]